jgi:hypothetical protein
MQIISRADAKALGLKHYFTSEPCRRGHVVERLVSSGGCPACKTITRKAWNEDNTEKAREQNKTWYAAHPEKNRAKTKAWREANPEKASETGKAWREANPDKFAASRTKRRAKRRACERDAIVPLTPEEQARVDAIYAESERLGWHVDHIKPITKGGLHHPDNLVAIPPVMNMGKGGQYWPDLYALQ